MTKRSRASNTWRLYVLGAEEKANVDYDAASIGQSQGQGRQRFHKAIGVWQNGPQRSNLRNRLRASVAIGMRQGTARLENGGELDARLSGMDFGLRASWTRDWLRPPVRSRTSRLVSQIGLDLHAQTFGLEGTAPLPASTLAFGPVAIPAESLEEQVGSGFRVFTPAAYAVVRGNFTRRLSATLGLRAELYSWDSREAGGTSGNNENYFRWAPTLDVAFAATRTLSFSARVGRSHQTPYAFELAAPWGTPELEPIRADMAEVSARYTGRKHLVFQARAFALRRANLPRINDSLPGLSDGAVYASFTGTDTSRSRGLELWLQHRLTPKTFGWVSYTLAKVKTAMVIRRPA